MKILAQLISHQILRLRMLFMRQHGKCVNIHFSLTSFRKLALAAASGNQLMVGRPGNKHRNKDCRKDHLAESDLLLAYKLRVAEFMPQLKLKKMADYIVPMMAAG